MKVILAGGAGWIERSCEGTGILGDVVGAEVFRGGTAELVDVATVLTDERVVAIAQHGPFDDGVNP